LPDRRVAQAVISSLVDWLKGPMRMTFAIGDVEFRQFELSDAQDLFAVRNHESVRRFMPTAEVLNWEDHIAWAQVNLCGGPILLFVARRSGTPVGFTLIKALANPDSLELGVMFTSSEQKSLISALGAAYTGCLAVDMFGARELVTYASTEHSLALRLNQGLGLQPGPSDKAGEYAFRTPRDVLLASRAYRRHASALQRSLQILGPSDTRQN